MSTLQEVELAISEFTEKDLKAFRDWYDEFDSNNWDNKLEKDVKAGKLDKLGNSALADFLNNKCKEL